MFFFFLVKAPSVFHREDSPDVTELPTSFFFILSSVDDADYSLHLDLKTPKKMKLNNLFDLESFMLKVICLF